MTLIVNRMLAKLTSRQISGIVLGMVMVSGGFGYLLSQATRVQVDSKGISIEKQAIATQKDLEKSLLLNQIQQQTINRLLQETSDFSERYKPGKQLLKEQQETSSVIPEGEIDELEESAQQSKKVLLNKRESEI